MDTLVAISSQTLKRIEEHYDEAVGIIKDLARQMENVNQPKLLTIAQVAEYFQVSIGTIKRWKDDIGYVHKGHSCIRFKMEDIKAFEANGYIPPRKL